MRCWPSTPMRSRSTSRHSGPSRSCRSKGCARVLRTAIGPASVACQLVVRSTPASVAEWGHARPIMYHLKVTQGETTMATPQLTFNTGQTAILMADFHREGMGDNPMVQERGIVQKARAVLEAARQAGVLVVYIVVNFRPGYREISDRDVIFR